MAPQIVVSPGSFVSPSGTSRRGHRLVDRGREVRPGASPGAQDAGHAAVVVARRLAHRLLGGSRPDWTTGPLDHAADGSDADNGGVPVTDDAALDWNPTWSPDGRLPLFLEHPWRPDRISGGCASTSTRAGCSDEPEPVTTPSTWSGYLSFSRDGTRLAFASQAFQSTLLRVPFDAARGAVTGPPVPVLKGTRAIRDHEVSPDGEWVAFTEAGVPEDLFVARVDGSQYRRLTDDQFRDRGPAWAPDGREHRILLGSIRARTTSGRSGPMAVA